MCERGAQYHSRIRAGELSQQPQTSHQETKAKYRLLGAAPQTRQRTESEDENDNAGVCAHAIKVFDEAVKSNLEEQQEWIDDVLKGCDGYEKGSVTVPNSLYFRHVVKTQRIVDALVGLMRLMRFDEERKNLLSMGLIRKLGMLLIRITVRDTDSRFEQEQWKRMANIDLCYATKLFYKVRRLEDQQAYFALVAYKGLCSVISEYPDVYKHIIPNIKVLANAASLNDLTLEYKERIHAEARKAIEYLHKHKAVGKVVIENTLWKLPDEKRTGLREWLSQFQETV